MIIISYYTKNTPYKKVLEENLLSSLKHFKTIPYEIEEIENKGSWQLNTHFKAEFLKEKLIQHKKPIVFLDVDAQIKKYPYLFDKLENYDIGLHFLDWSKHWKNEPSNRKDALSGTLFLNYNKKVFQFLDLWIEKNKTNIQWEQKNMQEVLTNFKNELKIYELPYSYATIILHDNSLPVHMINPNDIVILHTQASRKYKRKI